MKNLFILILFATSQLVFGQSPLLPIWANDFDYIEEAVEKVTDGPNPLENIVVAGDLVINEFMAINQTSVADQNGEYDDWIELYNNTDSTLSLSGLYLTDNPVDSSRWFFPDTIIDPHGFLIIWADNDSFQVGLHASFRLSGNGESIYLGYDNGLVIDSIIFNDQNQDISFSRIPNGTGNFQPSPPSFSAINSGFVVNDTLVPGSLVINEFMAENQNRFFDQNGESDDWIELYNNTDTTLSLFGLFLSDDSTLPSKWAFPDTSIQPMSFLIIWADEDLNQNGLHANFRLSNNGEFLSLAYADGTMIDSVSFGIQDNDTTFGRFPNGTGSFGLMYPTFGKSNGFFTAIDRDLSESSARIYLTQP
ncbi:MAG: lamin tail domain-containing protein [Bacteroidia bacterium]